MFSQNISNGHPSVLWYVNNRPTTFLFLCLCPWCPLEMMVLTTFPFPSYLPPWIQYHEWTTVRFLLRFLLRMSPSFSGCKRLPTGPCQSSKSLSIWAMPAFITAVRVIPSFASVVVLMFIDGYHKMILGSIMRTWIQTASMYYWKRDCRLYCNADIWRMARETMTKMKGPHKKITGRMTKMKEKMKGQEWKFVPSVLPSHGKWPLFRVVICFALIAFFSSTAVPSVNNWLKRDIEFIVHKNKKIILE